LGNFDREYILEQKANVFVLKIICFPTFADKNTEINISKLACADFPAGVEAPSMMAPEKNAA